MCEIETCGFRATGLTLVDIYGSVNTIKQDTNATNFFEDKEVNRLMDLPLQTAIGHCRFPTKGDAKFHVNNHPFTFGNTTIVHQGVLSNDDELKEKYDFKPEGETDSWIIVHLIEKYRNEGKSVIDAIAQAHSELKGSWAVALVDALEPEKLYLFCHYKSFKVNYFVKEEVFFFSTQATDLDKFNIELTKHFEYFEELRKHQVAEIKVGDEDCLVLGGENEVEMWDLPAPAYFYSPPAWLKKDDSNNKDKRGKKKFGDGFKMSKKEEEEYWENYFKKEEKGTNGRHPLKKNELAII